MPHSHRLPYTDAVIHETLRIVSLAQLGAQHIATRDTKLKGYTIPKVSSVHANLANKSRPFFELMNLISKSTWKPGPTSSFGCL